MEILKERWPGIYQIALFKASGKLWLSGIINGFKRKEGSSFDLLYLALKSVLGNRPDRFLTKG